MREFSPSFPRFLSHEEKTPKKQYFNLGTWTFIKRSGPLLWNAQKLISTANCSAPTTVEFDYRVLLLCFIKKPKVPTGGHQDWLTIKSTTIPIREFAPSFPDFWGTTNLGWKKSRDSILTYLNVYKGARAPLYKTHKKLISTANCSGPSTVEVDCRV